MAKKIEAYECEYCHKKILRSKSGIRNHEKRCFWNPEVKACMSCINYIRGGHYAHSCFHQSMNTENEFKVDRTIKKLQFNCSLYEYDEMNNEERKRLKDEQDYDAKADWDDYYDNIGVNC